MYNTTNIKDYSEYPFWESPKMGEYFRIKANVDSINNSFVEDFESQTRQFLNIGKNIIDEYQIYDITELKKFLVHIDENILGISGVENVLMDEKKTISFGYFIYQILYVDLFMDYIPGIMISNNKDYSIDYLRSLLLDPTAFGILLEQYLYGQIKIFTNNVNGTSLQTKSKYLKIAISIDLFDNDLDKFINTFILPVIEIEENWNNIQDKIVMMS